MTDKDSKPTQFSAEQIAEMDAAEKARKEVLQVRVKNSAIKIKEQIAQAEATRVQRQESGSLVSRRGALKLGAGLLATLGASWLGVSAVSQGSEGGKQAFLDKLSELPKEEITIAVERLLQHEPFQDPQSIFALNVSPSVPNFFRASYFQQVAENESKYWGFPYDIGQIFEQTKLGKEYQLNPRDPQFYQLVDQNKQQLELNQVLLMINSYAQQARLKENKQVDVMLSFGGDRIASFIKNNAVLNEEMAKLDVTLRQYFLTEIQLRMDSLKNPDFLNKVMKITPALASDVRVKDTLDLATQKFSLLQAKIAQGVEFQKTFELKVTFIKGAVKPEVKFTVMWEAETVPLSLSDREAKISTFLSNAFQLGDTREGGFSSTEVELISMLKNGGTVTYLGFDWYEYFQKNPHLSQELQDLGKTFIADLQTELLKVADIQQTPS